MNRIKRLTALFLAVVCVAAVPACSKKTDTVTVAVDTFSENTNPFFVETETERLVADLTQLRLLTLDRAGNPVLHAASGETKNENGTDRAYTGAADIDVSYAELTDITTFTIRLRDGMTFSDGTAVTADDLIFTYYIACDREYTGSYTVSDVDILGLRNYRYNSVVVDSYDVSDTEIERELAYPSEELREKIESKVIRPILAGELNWIRDNLRDLSALYATDDALRILAYMYNTVDGYATDGKSEQDVLADLSAQYGINYRALSVNYTGGDDSLFDLQVRSLAYDTILDRKLSSEGSEVPAIEGIRKMDEMTVEIRVNGQATGAIYDLCDLYIAPLHHYGDRELYSYDENRFGFTRNAPEPIRSPNNTPLGGGAYVYYDCEDSTVTLHANPRYAFGAPKTETLKLLAVGTSAAKDLIRENEVAMASLSLYAPAETSDGERWAIHQATAESVLSLGINAETVRVGDDPTSEASVSLRRALASVIYACRAEIVGASGGCLSASSLDERTPLQAMDGKLDEARQYALEALIAAGYTAENGKVTAAPESAGLTYTAFYASAGENCPERRLLHAAAEELSAIGITLHVAERADLDTELQTGTCDLWLRGVRIRSAYDLARMFASDRVHSASGENFFALATPEMDARLEAALRADLSAKDTVLRDCIGTAATLGVFVPLWHESATVFVDTKLINKDSLPQEMTAFYGWTNEAHCLAPLAS